MKEQTVNLNTEQVTKIREARNACYRASSAVAHAAMAIGEAGWTESSRRFLGLHCRSIDLALAVERFTDRFLK